MESKDISLMPHGGAVGPPADSLKQETIFLLRSFNVRARKELGQNFLVDREALEQIIAAADLSPSDTVLEVGPGLGVLTRELAKVCRTTIAVEIDPKMVAVLKYTLSGLPNAVVVQQDVLAADPAQLLSEALGEDRESIRARSYKVVANLPYYITSLAIRHFLEAELKPRSMVLTIQKEVAERIAAVPGRLSLLAVSVQVYGNPRLVATVPASSFFPQPKVDSAILCIDVFDRPAVMVDDIDAFFEVVQAGFSQPRKQLHNAISQRIWLPPGKAPELLREAGIDSSRRAQTLSLAEWTRVYQALRRIRKAGA